MVAGASSSGFENKKYNGMGKQNKDQNEIAIEHLEFQIEVIDLYALIDASWIMTTADLISRYFGKDSHQYMVFVGWQERPRVNFIGKDDQRNYFESKKWEVIRILNDCIRHIERFGIKPKAKGKIFPAFRDWQTICGVLTVLGGIGYFLFDLGGKIRSAEIPKDQYARDRQLDSFKIASKLAPIMVDTAYKKAENKEANRIIKQSPAHKAKGLAR